MKAILTPLIVTTYLLLMSCSKTYEPTVFERGIFKRNVSQVTINNKQIEKNTKEISHNLEEIKVIKERVATKVEAK